MHTSLYKHKFTNDMSHTQEITILNAVKCITTEMQIHKAMLCIVKNASQKM